MLAQADFLPDGVVPFVIVPLLAILGAVLGAVANVCVDAWGWDRRHRSPWRILKTADRPLPWWTYLPIVGWWGLRLANAPSRGRSSSLAPIAEATEGRWFWLRGMLIEIFAAVAVPCLYLFLIDGGLLPARYAAQMGDATVRTHVWFLLFLITYFGLYLATIIDLEDQLIPDQITLPITVIALLIAALAPSSRLPVLVNRGLDGREVADLQVASPHGFPGQLRSVGGLAIVLAIGVAWGFALLPRFVTFRRGPIKAVQFFFAVLARSGWIWGTGVALFATVLTLLVWFFDQEPDQPHPMWQSYSSAMIGLGVGGGLVWAIRLLGRLALGLEAMGFGDVTLMAMVGAAFGWQATVMSFFLAPFAAIFFAIGRLLLNGQRDIPFGPYLAIGSIGVTLGWQWMWFGWADRIFEMGDILVAILVCGLALMTAMLFGIRLFKSMMWGEQRPSAP